jgi:hypothetical protein
MAITDEQFDGLEPVIPLLLTPGAAEAVAVKVYRVSRTSACLPVDALRQCLTGYRNPISPEVLESQIRLALEEASDPDFVPEFFANRKQF